MQSKFISNIIKFIINNIIENNKKESNNKKFYTVYFGSQNIGCKNTIYNYENNYNKNSLDNKRVRKLKLRLTKLEDKKIKLIELDKDASRCDKAIRYIHKLLKKYNN